MHKRKEYIFPPALAMFGGLIGYMARRFSLSTGFEPETGLPVAGSPVNMALIALSVLVAVLLLLTTYKLRNAPITSYSQAFNARGNTFYSIGMVICAFALLTSGAFMIREPDRSLIKFLLAALCAASAFCVLFVSKSNARGERIKPYSISLLIPGFACCVWLISAYQLHAGNPVKLDYIYQLLAIICTLLGLYFTASFSFAKPKVAPTAFFSMMGVYFSLVCMADHHSISFSLLFTVSTLMPLISTTTMLRNVFLEQLAEFTNKANTKNESN